MTYQYLDSINSNADLRALPDDAMPVLCAEIRDFLVHAVEEHGGHLASNLGVVELTVAMHRVFNPGKDHLIFDTGHQSYVHKILTGRRDDFDTLRVPGGLCGFPNRAESPCDPFGTGHSATAISAALGFAEADRLAGRHCFSVVVIGDGAYTGGMVHEALNNIRKDRNLIIILNENEMSISPNIGRFASYIAKVRTGRRYVKAKKYTARILSHLPLVGRPILALSRKIKQKMKNKLYNSNYFEELGLFYIGPIDGNDYDMVLRALEEAAAQGENVLVHIKTVKGKGYPPAENEPSRYHSLPPQNTPLQNSSFHSVFGETLTALADEDPRITAVTAAMENGTGLCGFALSHPERFFDVGIAEEHALTFSAGMAANGLCPFFAVYSTFLQRGYDNILHDIALQHLPVKIAVDRAGLAVADGATHHGIFDVAFLSHIPDVEILAPATYGSMRAMLSDMTRSNAPQALRYPNAAEDPRSAPLFYPHGDYDAYGVRASFAENEKTDALLVTYSGILSAALDARDEWKKQGKNLGILLLEMLAPYEKTVNALLPYLRPDQPLLFLEEGVCNGGAAMIIEKALRDGGYAGKTVILAIRNAFTFPETPTDLYTFYGIGKENILRALQRETTDVPD